MSDEFCILFWTSGYVTPHLDFSYSILHATRLVCSHFRYQYRYQCQIVRQSIGILQVNIYTHLLPVTMNEPIADPIEKDSLQQRQQMWNVARQKPMIRKISPPPNRPCVALNQSISYNHQSSTFRAVIIKRSLFKNY